MGGGGWWRGGGLGGWGGGQGSGGADVPCYLEKRNCSCVLSCSQNGSGLCMTTVLTLRTCLYSYVVLVFSSAQVVFTISTVNFNCSDWSVVYRRFRNTVELREHKVLNLHYHLGLLFLFVGIYDLSECINNSCGTHVQRRRVKLFHVGWSQDDFIQVQG